MRARENRRRFEGAYSLSSNALPCWSNKKCCTGRSGDVGMGFKLVCRTLVDMNNMVATEAKALAAVFDAEYGASEVVSQVVGVIEARGTKVTRILAAADQ